MIAGALVFVLGVGTGWVLRAGYVRRMLVLRRQAGYPPAALERLAIEDDAGCRP